MMSSDSVETQVVGGSVEGPKHEGTDTPCQDAWAERQLPDGRFVVAVGDGLGSATHSHEGSAIATETVVDHLEAYLESTETIERREAQDALKAGFVAAREAIAAAASERDIDTAELATTLLAVVGGPGGLAGAGAGDGGAVYGVEDSYQLLFPREESVADLGASYKTFPLTHDDWEQYYRSGFADDWDRISVVSDGVEEWCWENTEEINPSWFRSAFDLVGTAPDPESASEKLRTALDNDNYRLSSDDKTVVMGLREPDETDGPGVSETADSQPERDATVAEAVKSAPEESGSSASGGVEASSDEDSDPHGRQTAASITEVVESMHSVTLVVEPPERQQFEVVARKPPIWGRKSCKLEKLLDEFGVGPDDIDSLLGREVPCTLVGSGDTRRPVIEWERLIGGPGTSRAHPSESPGRSR